MPFKVIYLVIGIMVLFVKEAFCDPISAIAAVGGALSGIGATLGPAGVLAAGGLGLEGFSLLNAPKVPGAANPASPTAPDPNAAAEAASQQQLSSRRALLLSGGDVNLTGVGGAPISSSSVSSKVLLGGG